MEYRNLGKSDLEVPVISFGCWQFGSVETWGEQSQADSTEAVHAALDCGINLFDTAAAYGGGQSEEVLGKALKGRRSEAIIASKQGSPNPAQIEARCDHSLKMLGTDVIDLYQIHWARHETPLEDHLEVMHRLRDKGKIRYFGVSNFGLKDMEITIPYGEHPLVSNQLPYSLLWRAIEDEINPVLDKNTVGLLCYSPLMQGLLTGRYKTPDSFPEGRRSTRVFTEDGGKRAFETLAEIEKISDKAGISMQVLALHWLLSNKTVSSVITGARNAKQIRENAAVVDTTVDPQILNQLTAATDSLKQAMGPNPDLWRSGSDSLYR
ncbi:MAG: aldo/keto reductase [Opitutaceae bacterium]|nr:aldo/keto reductase [Opitutaceae bacterium]